LMLRHLPTGTRESLGERASWRSLGAFLPVLASGVFCFAFFDASILALLPLYGMDKGLNEGLAVLLVTVVLTGDAMFQTPLGWLADRVGRKRVLIGSVALFGVFSLATAHAWNLPSLLTARLLTGVGLGAA
ncbi:MFS transporter, partial [Mycobacterium tuberculosis]|nr:MFS transporter [Mycobacterium tuberculosis]